MKQKTVHVFIYLNVLLVLLITYKRFTLTKVMFMLGFFVFFPMITSSSDTITVTKDSPVTSKFISLSNIRTMKNHSNERTLLSVWQESSVLSCSKPPKTVVLIGNSMFTSSFLRTWYGIVVFYRKLRFFYVRITFCLLPYTSLEYETQRCILD